jgi:hypothetical protein
LTQTGHEVDDVGGSLSWRAFSSFLQNLGIESQLGRELQPEVAKWSSIQKTNEILADIYDVLSVINANLIGIGSGKRPKQPKPYPRPGHEEKNTRKFGRGAVTHDELVAFFDSKRKKHG